MSWKCKNCGAQFKTRAELISHNKEFHPVRALTYICPICGASILSRRSYSKHMKEVHEFNGRKKSLIPVNCRYCGRQFTRKCSCHFHEIHCPENPDRTPIIGRKLTPDIKSKISESMKLAHKEGRAHNIGECRWNNEPSYPERWFIGVLKNEFNLIEGKDYKRELSFHKYSLDFAFPDAKFCIEIDGEQHELAANKKRDQEKDSLLNSEGWIEVREKWKVIFNDPKSFIDLIRLKLSELGVIS